MVRFYTYGVFILLLACGIPFVADAGPVIRSGDTVALTQKQSVNGDLYLLGGTVSSYADVVGDAYALGAGVTIHGKVTSDVAVVGGAVEISAPVGDDVRVVGGTVVIGNDVAGDVVVFGGQVTLLPSAHVTGDVLFYGGSLDVEGPVHGSILAKGERIRVDSAVDGDVVATAYSSLTFGSHAYVLGSVDYKSPQEIIRALESEIVGGVKRTTAPLRAAGESTSSTLMPFFVLLFTSLVVRFLCGRRIDELIEHTLRRPVAHGALGIGVLIFVPLCVGLLFMSVVGFVLGLALIFLYLAVVIASTALAPLLVGAVISRWWKKQSSYSVLWVSLGAVVLFLLSHIPYIGFLWIPIILSLIAGGVATRVYGYFSS